MVTTLIYGKSASKIFVSRNSGLISTKLGIEHWGLGSIIVSLIGNPGLTLTYFMARSNFVTDFSIGKIENNGFFRNYCSL